jgi:hypothetical protein
VAKGAFVRFIMLIDKLVVDYSGVLWYNLFVTVQRARTECLMGIDTWIHYEE